MELKDVKSPATTRLWVAEISQTYEITLRGSNTKAETAVPIIHLKFLASHAREAQELAEAWVEATGIKDAFVIRIHPDLIQQVRYDEKAIRAFEEGAAVSRDR